MKPLRLFTVLTLASLMIYTVQSFAQVLQAEPESSKQPALTKTKTLTCGAKLKVELLGAGLPTTVNLSNIDETTGTLRDSDPGFAAATAVYSTNPQAKKALDNWGNCMSGTTPPANPDANPKCDNAEREIDKYAEHLASDCKGAYKASDDDDAASDAGAPTQSSSKLNVSDYGVCLQDAKTCDPAGDNDSAETCAEKSLDDIAKEGGNVTAKLQTFCQARYPKQCGPMDKVDLRATAKDADSALTTDLGSIKTQIEANKADLQAANDQVTKINKALTDLPDQLQKDLTSMQKRFEAQLTAEGKAIDATLDMYIKKIQDDQIAIKAAAAATSSADSIKFDAQNKFVNACKAEAKKEADKKYPTGGMNYGNANSLVTQKSNWAGYYSQILNFLYGDGTTCDGGAWASSKLALEKAQLAEVTANAQLLQDQGNMKTAMAQNDIKKGDANMKDTQDEKDAVNQRLKDQQKAIDLLNQDKRTQLEKIDKLNAKQRELDNKLTAGAQKRQCIQTIRQCANVPGIPSGSSTKDVADLADAPRALNSLIGACQAAAKSCNVEDKDKPLEEQKKLSLAEFNKWLAIKEGSTPVTKLPGDLPYDYTSRSGVCADALAAKLEQDGPLRRKKSRGSGTADKKH